MGHMLLCHEGGDSVVEKPLVMERLPTTGEVIHINGFHPENMTKEELAQWTWHAAANYQMWVDNYKNLQHRHRRQDIAWNIMGGMSIFNLVITFVNWLLL